MRPLVSLDLPIPMFYRVPLFLLRRMSSPLNALGADNPIQNALFDAKTFFFFFFSKGVEKTVYL